MTPTQEALAKAHRALARVQARLTLALKHEKPDNIKREILRVLEMLGTQKGDQ